MKYFKLSCDNFCIYVNKEGLKVFIQALEEEEKIKQFLAENDQVFKYKANWSDIYEKVVGNKRWELWFDDSGKTDLEIFYFNRDVNKHDPYYHPTSYCIFKGKCYTINDFIFICELLKVE